MILTLSPHLQAKLDWLREQIEFRTRGLQWVEFKTKWGSKLDDEVGTVPELTAHLKLILQTEGQRRAAGELPDSAPAPVFRRKTFKELGTPTMQARMNHSFTHSLMSHSFIISFTHSSAGG